MVEAWDVPMFEVPKPYRRPKKPAKAESWRSYKARKRLTCDLCILDAHAGAVTVPMAHARYIYTVAERVWNLCSIHAEQVKNRERKLPA